MKKTMRLFPLEVGRLFQSCLTWLTALLTVISPAAGFVLYKLATASTMLTIYLANPAIAGGVVGGILLACSRFLNWIASAAAEWMS